MEILVRGEKLKVTKAIQEYAEDKLSKINKYFGEAERVKAVVVVSAKGYKQKAEVTIPLKTVILRAEETREDLYAAIDEGKESQHICFVSKKEIDSKK